jgi:hypothetical protein
LHHDLGRATTRRFFPQNRGEKGIQQRLGSRNFFAGQKRPAKRFREVRLQNGAAGIGAQPVPSVRESSLLTGAYRGAALAKGPQRTVRARIFIRS